VDLGRLVCVRTHEFILEQNWRLHWGIHPLVIFRFLDSLWPFAPIAFFF
jgi:hypothetical protein